MKILLVEDDPILRRTMQHLLPHWGYQVDVADCGKAALDLLKDTEVDAVLLDQNLPDFLGCQIATILRHDLLNNCPIIIGLTGYIDPDEYQTFIDSGMDEVLQKPLQKKQLEDALSALAK